MAPGVGLYLDELFFDGYNLKVDYHDKESNSRGSSKIVESIDISEGSQSVAKPLDDKDDEDVNTVRAKCSS
jgi:hypothetical protein